MKMKDTAVKEILAAVFFYEGEVCTVGAVSVMTAAGEFSFRNFSQKEGILGFVEKYIVYKK